jgi:phytoene dehydrogenase-like protein
MWEELGAVQERSFVDHDEYARIVGPDNETLVVYCEVGRLERHMKALAPEDKDLIEEFTQAILTSTRFPIPWEKDPELWTPVDGLRLGLKMMPLIRFMKKWGKMTITEFTQRLRSPFLRETFPLIPNLQHPPEYPMLALLTTLAWAHQKNTGYPVGGSLEFARSIEERYLDLGGEISYGQRVTQILVRNNRAVGVRLADGSEHYADAVISAADGHTTIFDMLGGRYLDDTVTGYYDTLPLFPPLVYIGLGVARSFEQFPSTITGVSYPLEKPIRIDRRERQRMDVQMYDFDPTMAPAGKTSVRVMYASDYRYWADLHANKKSYRAEKERIADQVVSALDRRFPGLAGAVEMYDVATPITWVRYTGNWQGSFEGWLISTETLRMRMRKTLPGLEGFYMAGQWVMPGGSVPSAAVSARHVIQLMCRADRRSFVTTSP